ncbi:MAG: hypothetical protein JWP45_659 [Mucilaginibacter sp.]|nr:hypothetical protein [Mucilaginibacter sp.]
MSSKIWRVYLLLPGLLFTDIKGAFAQTQAQDKVTVDLNSSSIGSATLPFDVPFFLTGKAPDNCVQINFSYLLKPDSRGHFRSWATLPVENPDGVTYIPSGIPWVLQNGETNFNVLCMGIHPDLHYAFRFEEIKTILPDDKKLADMRQQIATRISQFSTTYAAVPFYQPAVDQLGHDLTAIVNSEFVLNANERLKQKGNPKLDYVVDMKGKLNRYTAQMLIAEGIVADETDNLSGTGGAYATTLEDEFNLRRAALLQDINTLLADHNNLTDGAKALLDLQVAPSTDPFKAYTLRNGLLVLKKLCQNQARLDMLVNGTAQISNNDIVDATAISPQSLNFLNVLIAFLADGNLTTTAAAPNNVMFGYLGDLNSDLHDVAQSTQKVADNKAKIAALTATIPDLSANIVLSETFTTDVVSIADVSTAATPYISVDGGLGYASSFGSAFSYVGTNIYLAPVNKKAPLSTFKGWNKWKKMICVSVGYATMYGDRPPHTYSILGSSSKSDLFVGLGLRVNRIFKFTFDCMPYTISYNPVTNDKHVKAGFVAGIGIDVNLLGALGGVAKGLALIP